MKTKWKEQLEELIVKNNLPIYICNDSTATCKTQYRANYNRSYDNDKSKYIVQYFVNKNIILVFKKDEHKSKTNIFTISKNKIDERLEDKSKIAIKGVEYVSWKQSTVYILTPDNIVDYFKDNL